MKTTNENTTALELPAVEETPTTLTVSMSDVPATDIMARLTNASSDFFSSIKDDGTRKSKIALYNAIQSADDALADHINEVLEIVDVVAFPISVTQEVTGEIIDTLMTVLIDKNGKSYTAVSEGITNSLSRIFGMGLKPSWKDEPLKMKIKQKATKNGNNKVNYIELGD